MAIARALITNPAIVLADEPTGNLDTRNSDAVLEMLRHASKELNQTVLMITHNPEAAAIADRILHMRDGEIVSVEQAPATWYTTSTKAGAPIHRSAGVPGGRICSLGWLAMSGIFARSANRLPYSRHSGHYMAIRLCFDSAI